MFLQVDLHNFVQDVGEISSDQLANAVYFDHLQDLFDVLDECGLEFLLRKTHAGKPVRFDAQQDLAKSLLMGKRILIIRHDLQHSNDLLGQLIHDILKGNSNFLHFLTTVLSLGFQLKVVLQLQISLGHLVVEQTLMSDLAAAVQPDNRLEEREEGVQSRMIGEGDLLVCLDSPVRFDARVSQIVLHFDDLEQYLAIALGNVVSDVVDGFNHLFTLLGSHLLHWHLGQVLRLFLLSLFLSLLLLLFQEIHVFSERGLVELQSLLEHLLGPTVIDQLQQVLIMIICKTLTSLRLKGLQLATGYLLEVGEDCGEAAVDILDGHLLSILVILLYEGIQLLELPVNTQQQGSYLQKGEILEMRLESRMEQDSWREAVLGHSRDDSVQSLLLILRVQLQNISQWLVQLVLTDCTQQIQQGMCRRFLLGEIGNWSGKERTANERHSAGQQ